MTVTAALSADQEALRDAFGSFFAKESPPERVRAAEPLGFDVDLWRELAALGVPDLALAGQTSLADLAVLVEEFGRHLAPVPLVEALVAARILERLGGCPDDVGDGRALATFSPRPGSGGVAHLVPAGAVADLVVVLDGDELVAVRPVGGAVGGRGPGSPPNLGATAVADRELTGEAVERSVLASGPDAYRAFSAALDEWRVLTAAALVGLAQGALDLGVEYAKARHQFGVPIGSFQSIQHKLADVATALAGARLLARRAAAVDRRELLAPMAFWYVGADGRSRRLCRAALPRRLRLHARVRRAALPPPGQGVDARCGRSGRRARGRRRPPRGRRVGDRRRGSAVRPPGRGARLRRRALPARARRAGVGERHDPRLGAAPGARRAGLADRGVAGGPWRPRLRRVPGCRDDRRAGPGRRPDGRLGDGRARRPDDRPLRDRAAAP